MDFRNLLRHKDRKKRKGVDEGPDWGDLKSRESLCVLLRYQFILAAVNPSFTLTPL